MPTDTVVSVKQRDGNRKPGFVKFSSAGELSTFSDAALQAAERLIGQRVEYTVEEKQSKDGTKTYRNLAEVKPAGGVSAEGSGVSFDVAPIVAQIKRVADGLEKLVSLFAGGTATKAAPAVDDIAAMEQRLAEKVGADAAKAMVAALREKHADAELKTALAKVLAANKVA